MALDYRYDNLLNKLGEFFLLEKTKIMLYLPTELTPNYSSTASGV